MEKIEILKIQNEDKSLTYRIRPEWEEDCFKILILLENSSSWYADVSDIDTYVIHNFFREYDL